MTADVVPDYKQPFRESFAARLISKLQEKGFASKRDIHQAHGQKLAREIGISLAMARNYINGKSIPKDLILHKIANLLDVDPNWLLYGNANINFTLTDKNKDLELFKEIFSQLFHELCNPNLTKNRYMALIRGCLEIYCKTIQIEQNTSKDRTILLMINFLIKNN